MKKHIVIIALMCILSLAITGCNTIKKLELKFGLANDSFDYMKNERDVKKLVIQSERDKGYRFEVTNKDVIGDIADILSRAKKSDIKSELKNDYVMEVYERDGTVKRYKYVAGLDKKYGGNFYSEDEKQIFVVSTRLDKDIIDNFSNIRKPVKFNEIYYEGILKVMESCVKDNKHDVNKTIGLNLGDDIEVQKYMLSLDISGFQDRMKEKYSFVKFEEDTMGEDYTFTVKTEGYTKEIYKMVIRIIDNRTTKEKKYYVWGKVDSFGDWIINTYSTMPENF